YAHPPTPPRDLPSFPTRRSSDLIFCIGDQTPVFRLEIHLPASSLRVGDSLCRSGQHHSRLLLILFRFLNQLLVTHTRIILLQDLDRKSTRLNSSHVSISYAVFCL